MSRHGALPYVDPRAFRGLLYRAWVSFLGTRVAAWLSMNVVWKVDSHLLRLTGGRVGLGLMIPTALLETRGARTGCVRRNAVIYFHDGERVTIIASKLGAPEHPSWYHNARANPDVLFGGQPFRVEAVDDETTRARLWELADHVFPVYTAYREKAARAGRTIPISSSSPAKPADRLTLQPTELQPPPPRRGAPGGISLRSPTARYAKAAGNQTPCGPVFDRREWSTFQPALTALGRCNDERRRLT